jgi:hypothetical protein
MVKQFKKHWLAFTIIAVLLCAGFIMGPVITTVILRGASGNEVKVNNIGQMFTADFLLEVSKGNVHGHSFINKFAENPDTDTGTFPEDVWDFGGIYTWTVDAGAAYFISSSDNSDNQSIEFSAITVDSNGNWNTEVFTQNIPGQTQTQLTPPSGDPVKMVYRMESMAVTGDNITGNLYVYENDTVIAGVPQTQTLVRGQINDGNNQTLMSQYIIPTGKVGFFYQILAGQSRAQTAGQSRLSLKTARFGEVFKVKGRIATVNSGSSNFTNLLVFPSPLSSRTEILGRIEEVSANNTGIYTIFDVLLIDEDLFTDEFLAAIGQVKRVE